MSFKMFLKTRGREGAALCVLMAVACVSEPGGRAETPEGKGATVTLHLEGAALAKGAAGAGAHAVAAALRPVDSAHITVTAPDMDTLRFPAALSGGSQSLSLMDVPPGDNRRFEVTLHQGGRRLYAGHAVTSLRTDRANAVSVVCLPDFSRITASIHVPVDFPKTVAGGRLRLWSDGDTLGTDAVASGELRHFRLEDVPGDREWTVALVLWGAAGDTIATAARSGVLVPKGQSVALVLPLSLAFTQIALTMTAGDPSTTTLVLSLPGARRAPAVFGDAVFSEVHPEPGSDDGGENGEWVELFNRVTDTLDVSGCMVLRDAGTGTGMKATLPSGTVIAPGRGLVLGRSASVTFAHVVTGAALNLINSGARLEFSCATTRIDTLRYGTSATDTTIARFTPGKVASLKPSRLATRHKADAWCLAVSPSLPSLTGEPVATPGGIIGGCGE